MVNDYSARPSGVGSRRADRSSWTEAGVRQWLCPLGAAAILASGSAFAADLSNRNEAPPAPVVAAPSIAWDGFYAGALAGVAWGI